MIDNNDLKLLPFKNLKDNEIEFIKNTSIKVKYNKNDFICSFQEFKFGFIHVLSGRVRVYIISDDLKEVTLFILNKNDTCILSINETKNHIAYETMVSAIDYSEVILIESSDYQRLIDNNNELKLYTYKSIVEKIGPILNSIKDMSFNSLDKRLANFLKIYSNNTNSKILYITQEEISVLINSAREAVSRKLKEFENEGILIQNRGYIKLLNLEKLDKYK